MGDVSPDSASRAISPTLSIRSTWTPWKETLCGQTVFWREWAMFEAAAIAGVTGTARES